MNVNIKPIERCFVHFEYDKQSDQNLCTYIKWLGFDRYKFLIYGIRDMPKFRDEAEINEKEIVMLSVCEMKISVIKHLHLQSQMPINHHGIPETAAINSAGNEIAVVRFYTPYRNCDGDEPKLNHRFYMFSIETGEMQSYKLFCDFKKEKWLRDYFLYHSSSLGWIFVNGYINIKTMEDSLYVIHRVVFNDSNKTCKLEYVTETCYKMDPDFTFSSFGEKVALVLPEKGDCIHAYDYKSKSWNTKKLYNFPDIPQNLTCRFVKHEQDIICVTFQSFLFDIAIDDTKDYLLYRLVNDQWEKMSLSLTYQSYYASQHPLFQYYFCSYNLLFLSFSLYGYGTYNDLPGNASDDKGHQLKITALCVTVNVAPLKLLAMRQIVVNYEKLCAERLLEEVDIPHILRRQFFGPSWIQKEIYK